MKNFYPTKTKTNTVLVRDEARYNVVTRAIYNLSELLSNGDYCSMSIRPNEMSETSMSVEFVTDSMTISTEEFSSSIALADSVSIKPNRSGLISIYLTFEGIYTPAVRIA